MIELNKKIPDIKKLEIKLFLSKTAIIVYQMGKVGSTTVYYSLNKQLFLTPVFHVHSLSDDTLKEYEKFYRSVGKIPDRIRYLRHGNFLRQKLNESKAIAWKIITLVREPIIRDISIFFQQIDRKFPNGIDTSEIINILQRHFASFEESTDYACTWFDREIKTNFDIDIYDFVFDKQKGYHIIKEKDKEVLIIRLEALNNCFQVALGEFLAINKPIKILSKNIAKDKQYKNQYLEVVNNIKIPKDVCELVYSSKHVKHFYSDAMIDDFVNRWAG